MFKQSQYNITIATEKESTLLYNSFSGSLVKLNTKYTEVLNDIENYENNEAYKIILSDLNKQGLIIDPNVDELALLQFNRNMGKYNKKSNVFQVTIAPTLKCNASCRYCFESTLKNITEMNLETADKIVEFIEKSISKESTKILILSWFGGEPLLRPDIIKYTAEKLIAFCNENDITYNHNITTNGVLLNVDNIKLLKDININRVNITIDGMEEMHNFRRPLKNKDSSFKRIIENILLAVDELPINIRVNLDQQNTQNVNDLIKYVFNDLKLRNKVTMYFSPVENFNKISIPSCGVFDNPEEFSKAVGPLINNLYEYGGRDAISNLIPHQTMFACGAEALNSYVIDPLGNLYKCWNVIGDESEIIGDIYNGIKHTKNHLDWYLRKDRDECSMCKLLPVCHGGCVMKKKYKSTYSCFRDFSTYRGILKLVFDCYQKL